MVPRIFYVIPIVLSYIHLNGSKYSMLIVLFADNKIVPSISKKYE